MHGEEELKHAQYLQSRSNLVQKLLSVHTDTHTHRGDCFTGTTKVVGVGMYPSLEMNHSDATAVTYIQTPGRVIEVEPVGQRNGDDLV